MTDDKRRKAEDTIAELDLRLDGLLGKLGASLGEMIERLERGDDGEVRRNHEIRTSRGPLRAETGVRVRVGGVQVSGGEPEARAAPSRAPAQDGARAPRADAGGAAGSGAAEAEAAPVRTADLEPHEAEGRWVLCADLPGVSLPEIAVEILPPSDAEPHGAVQVATRGDRRYEARHGLVAGLDTADMGLVLRNGVLEISFGRGGAA